MNKRSRQYFANKKWNKWSNSPAGNAIIAMKSKIIDSMWEYGVAASWIGLNEKNQIEAKILDGEEAYDLLRKYESGEPIPDGISIKTFSDTIK